MATKQCINGHIYDSAIYGDNCPFCPSQSQSTKCVGDNPGGKTQVVSSDPGATKNIEEFPGIGNISQAGTININGQPGANVAGGTVIRPAAGADSPSGKRLVGLLVSYSAVSSGEVYKVYEGRTTIGRDYTCDIMFPNDSSMSSKHLLIQYVAAAGRFRAQEFDKGSANGSYVNGKVYILGDVIELKSGDVIVLGNTKLLFIAIPEF